MVVLTGEVEATPGGIRKSQHPPSGSTARAVARM